MKTILVSGASGIVGYGILKSLRQDSQKYKLVGTTVYECSAANAFCDIFEKAPLTSSGDYIPWLINIIDKHQVDMIIPSIEADVVAWNDNRALLEKSRAFVLLNNSDLIRLCADKWLFYERLKKHNSPYIIPSSLIFNHEQKFPLLLKPRCGSASKGIVIVQSLDKLAEYTDELGINLMVQPVIGSAEEEYSTSAFFDSDSNLCAYMSIKRKLSKEGFTEVAKSVEVEGMAQALLDLAEILRPVGPTNFQFRVCDGHLKLLEINPRISSATSIRTAFGYNESSMSVDYFLRGVPLSQPAIQKGYAVRYTEDLIYYDCPNC